MELGAGTIAEAAILDAGSVTTVPEGVSSTQAAEGITAVVHTAGDAGMLAGLS